MHYKQFMGNSTSILKQNSLRNTVTLPGLNNGRLSHKPLFYWDFGSFILFRDVNVMICHMEPTTGVAASRADEPAYRNTINSRIHNP